MKAFSQLGVLILAASLSGCASPQGYFIDRGRDAKDIFTATVGLGVGAKVRVGPVQLPLLFNADAVGLRGGEFFGLKKNRDCGFLDRFSGLEISQPIPLYDAKFGWMSGAEEFDLPGVLRERRKGIQPTVIGLIAYERFSCSCGKHPRSSYCTQIEGCIGLGPSVRLGFNVGELVDFILGWTTIDIYNDDLEKRRKSNKALHASRYTRQRECRRSH